MDPPSLPPRRTSSPIARLATAGLLMAAGVLLGVRVASTADQPPLQEYFYNLSSGELIALPQTTLSPASLKNGQTVFRARVYSCRDCSDPAQRKIGFLEKSSDAAIALYRAYPRPGSIPTEQAGPLLAPESTQVATVEGATNGLWEPAAESPLTGMSFGDCDLRVERAIVCIPPQLGEEALDGPP